MTAPRALVCGAGGFVGGHLVRRLLAEGYWVRGVDLKAHEFAELDADEFVLADLRDVDDAHQAVDGEFDEVYQLAADMGGMGFIHDAATDIMRHNATINVNMIDAAVRGHVGRYFFASSVCVYPDMAADDGPVHEDDVYPAMPDNEYGWEKLYGERLVRAHGAAYGMSTRIARFQNTYGIDCAWTGGREKAPAALCRKVALASDGDDIEIWGDGSAVRGFTHVDDLVDGILALMRSDEDRPTNIGAAERHSILDLVNTIAAVADKSIGVRPVEGPVGVAARNFGHGRIEALGWQPTTSLHDGMAELFPWVRDQACTT